MQDFYILVLSIVFKETQYFILMEHPQNLKKKQTNFWLSRFVNSWQGHCNSIHVKLINCRPITVSFPHER